MASMGRSGSTFLSELINYDNEYRIMFEPFRFDRVAEAKDFTFPTYIGPNDQATTNQLLGATKIIKGNVRSIWIDKENKTLFPKGRMIKDIRVNFFLKWLKIKFPKIKVILLLRHPCSVVTSWLNAGFGGGEQSLIKLMANQDVLKIIGPQAQQRYKSITSDFERLIFFWCLHYKIPLSHLDAEDFHLVFYENLVTNPKFEIRNLFKFMQREYDESKVLLSMSRPSSTTKKTAEEFKADSIKINQWHNKLTEKEVDLAYEILSCFGFDKIYDRKTSLPNQSELIKILK
jgi:hypothetical protein